MGKTYVQEKMVGSFGQVVSFDENNKPILKYIQGASEARIVATVPSTATVLKATDGVSTITINIVRESQPFVPVGSASITTTDNELFHVTTGDDVEVIIPRMGMWTLTAETPDGSITKQVNVTQLITYTIRMSLFKAYIDVHYPVGYLCTCTDGYSTYIDDSGDGQYTFEVGSTGVWTVSASDGTITISDVAEITESGQHVSISLQKGGSSKLASEYAIGDTVYLPINGATVEFIVVHQGLPSSDYHATCNNTWLLMKDIYKRNTWDSSDNDYANSDIHSYLNGPFLNLFNNVTQNAIRRIYLPYWQGRGISGSYMKGGNGLSTKIFLLSGYEVGFTMGDASHLPGIGARLAYFKSGSGTSARNKRKANYSGSATSWWLRSPSTDGTSSVFYIDSYGTCYSGLYSNSYGVRPALVINNTTLFDENNVIIG